MDFKPDNFMMFDKSWKLIDVDCCFRAGTRVRLEDTAIYNSPCYCAPEMARFLSQGAGVPITILPSLDVWSVGMVICELVHLEAVLQPRYKELSKRALSSRHACRIFLAWLGSADPVDFLPQDVGFNADLRDFVLNCLLVLEGTRRKSLAQCLSAPYIEKMVAAKPLPNTGSLLSLKFSLSRISILFSAGASER